MTINGIICKLLAKKGKKAEIEIEGQKVMVPSEYLPASAKSGENLELRLVSAQTSQMKEKELARAILEEILNGGK